MPPCIAERVGADSVLREPAAVISPSVESWRPYFGRDGRGFQSWSSRGFGQVLVSASSPSSVRM